MRFTTWLVLIATLLLWSGNWIVARAVRDEISPGLATVGRLVVVLAILLPFAWRGLRQKLPQLAPRDWLVLRAPGLTRGRPHPRPQLLRVIELLCMVCAFGVLFMTPWLLFEAAAGATLALSRTGALAVLYSAIGSLLLAYAGWSYVVARLGPARAGVTLHLMPAFGVVLSALFLNEYPRWFHFAGIALILAGVALSAFKRRLTK